MQNRTPPLYEKMANDLTRMIEQETFRPGDRFPSIRHISQQMKVSITTAMEAYRLLEDRDLIEARPQSGYYVRPINCKAALEPSAPIPEKSPTAVSISELVQMVFRDIREEGMILLGVALPGPENLPVDKLNRILASVVRRKGNQSISYEMVPGFEGLRVQIARRALEAGCTLNPREILITSGCQEAVMMSLLAICRPGDAVAIESPSYFDHLQTLEALKLKAVEIATDVREGVNLDALEAALKKKKVRACLFNPNFSNPLGSLMPVEKKKALAEMLGGYDVPLIEDDVWGDLSFGPERPWTVKAFDKKDLVLLCSSISKTLAPGYRIGWVAGGRYQQQLERLKSICTIATASAPQMAIAEFLANGGYDRHLRRIRRVYMRQVWEMTRAVVKFFPPGTRVSRPEGGFILWVELPQSIDSLKLYEAALKEKITIAPGPIFSVRQKYRNYIRLHAASWNETIEKALATLGRLAETMLRQTAPSGEELETSGESEFTLHENGDQILQRR
jgi:DNA-binding transcriptional MocR family regulator